MSRRKKHFIITYLLFACRTRLSYYNAPPSRLPGPGLPPLRPSLSFLISLSLSCPARRATDDARSSSITMPQKHKGPAPFIQTQPRISHFSLRGLLSLPRRLCSPPAAVGKVRSFGLTPIFDVRLEDVLDRKHLPPLSLKDFEEWLLYVEQSVENLYFILWLREYTVKYDRWIAKVRAREAKNRQHHQHGRGASHSPAAAYRVAWSVTTPYSPALALFFSRARETFLVPGAPYELSLPPALLDALAVVNGHPDPAVLAPARAHVEEALRASLARCVRAAYTNVGTYRAACGIAAGIFFLLVGTVPPLAVNFTHSQSRWERLVIIPGLWFGLTILIASLRGICMMIYIFGDFRQLRKYVTLIVRECSKC